MKTSSVASSRSSSRECRYFTIAERTSAAPFAPHIRSKSARKSARKSAMVARMRRALAVAMAFAGTAACSYVFELPASDIIPGLDAAIADAATDARDANVVIDVDAEPPPRFCATRTAPFVYCTDFDDTPTPDL